MEGLLARLPENAEASQLEDLPNAVCAHDAGAVALGAQTQVHGFNHARHRVDAACSQQQLPMRCSDPFLPMPISQSASSRHLGSCYHGDVDQAGHVLCMLRAI